jgi:hypothetical protein
MGAFLTYVAPPQAIVISHDSGGIVQEYEDIAALYAKEGRRIEITGLCSSACTLALTVPNTCVGKNAIVAWHQAYATTTREPRPEVTERMLSNLPTRLKNYLQGRVKVEYTPETTLHYEQLVALGIPACGEPIYKAPTATANVTYSSPVSKPLTPPEVPVKPVSNKNAEWADFWVYAYNQSRAQFGAPNTAKYCFENSECSRSVYYYDGRRQYVSVVEYYKAGKVIDRQVCRAPTATSKTMTCVGWNDETTSKYVQNPSTGQFVEAKQ